MAAFLKVLAGMIPWADVAKSAPAILAAAKDLIEGAPKQRPPEPPPPAPGVVPPGEELQLLHEETGRLRAYIVELQADSRRQAEVIERLAVQADRLIEGIETLRKWLRIASVVAVSALVLAAICFATLLFRIYGT